MDGMSSQQSTADVSNNAETGLTRLSCRRC